MKSLRTEAIEQTLADRFGSDAFVPRGDIDRPFSPGELRDFARNKLVHLGNHTANHAILTNYSPSEVRQQLRDCQNALRDIAGVEPVAIAYPNGAYSDEVLAACRDEGLRMGFTIRPEKSALPLDENSVARLRIGRFAPHGDHSMLSQCRTYRSDWLLYGRFRDSYLRFRCKPVSR
jgi:peptidoglycan/xylan/chitin deacetylase (PgdA/CDA1 family)